MDEIREIAHLFRAVCMLNRQIDNAAIRSSKATNTSERYYWASMVRVLTAQRDDTLSLIDIKVWR